MKRLACLFFLLGVYTVDSRWTLEALIGGRDTEPNQIPYIVALQNSTKHLCGGGIIADQFILTAAHCVVVGDVDFRPFPLKIIAGVNDLNAEPETRVVLDVEKIYVSARYNHSFWEEMQYPYDDVAVLKLKEKLDIDGNVGLSVLDLPKKLNGTNEYDSYRDKTVRIAGFGDDYVYVRSDESTYQVLEEYSNSTGKLHQAKALVLDNEYCSAVYLPLFDSQICAMVVEHEDGTPQGICTGDSGSPLVDGNTLIGVVSANGPGCDENIAPAIYARVSSFVDFIRNAMNDVTDGMRVATFRPGDD